MEGLQGLADGERLSQQCLVMHPERSEGIRTVRALHGTILAPSLIPASSDSSLRPAFAGLVQNDINRDF